MIRKFIVLLIDILFPITCSFCGRSDFFSSKLSICKDCCKKRDQYKLSLINDIQCEICGSTITNLHCDYCNSRNIFFSKLNYIRHRGDFERELIQKIKFGNSPYLSNFFRFGLAKLLPFFRTRNYAAIVNIPSNRKTIRNRPIPVCKPVVAFLSKRLRIKAISPFLKKSKELQSGKDFRDRFVHSQSAFMIKKMDAKNLSGNYLLVDDVFTTGATINEISKLLLMNGATLVDVLVLVKGKM